MSEDCFEIGGEDLLSSITDVCPSIDAGGEGMVDPGPHLDVLEDIRARVGTLLKTETVSLLLGAGASIECGGLLIGSIPLPIERVLHDQGNAGVRQPQQWLVTFYLAVRHAGGAENTPATPQEILSRRNELESKKAEPLPVNFEKVLATLHLWRSALSESGNRLQIHGTSPVDVHSNELDESISRATDALACACDLPTKSKKHGLKTYTALIQKLLTRPLNLKRMNVFTLNYDTLVEQAADSSGVVLLDGFVGTQNRVLRPESYDQDLYFPAETTEGRVHRFDRVLHLYKLHGSITWTANEPTLENPYGVRSTAFNPEGHRPLLIYPTPAKYGEILGFPYSELFRRFADTIARPQSVLFIIGYGFGDEHVNAIVRKALAVPSFILIIVDPLPKSNFVATLRDLKDQRVWVSTGPTLGKLAGFVHHVLPDLQNEDIRRRVLITRRALGQIQSLESGARDDP